MKWKHSSSAADRGNVQGKQPERVDAARALIPRVAQGSRDEIKYGLLNDPGVRALAAQSHLVSVNVPTPVLKAHRNRFSVTDRGKICPGLKRFVRPAPRALEGLLGAAQDWQGGHAGIPGNRLPERRKKTNFG